jgi:hypothetical protein
MSVEVRGRECGVDWSVGSLPLLPVLLWCLAVLFYIFGDVMTTAMGQSVGLYEANPFVRFILAEYGIWVFTVLKGLFVSLLFVGHFGFYQVHPSSRRLQLVIPIWVMMFGVPATVNNVYWIVQV